MRLVGAAARRARAARARRRLRLRARRVRRRPDRRPRARHAEGEIVRMRLEGIGFGFLIPIYFVVTGMNFDLDSLLTARGLGLAAMFLGLLLVVRGASAFLWLRELGCRRTLALALFGATGAAADRRDRRHRHRPRRDHRPGGRVADRRRDDLGARLPAGRTRDRGGGGRRPGAGREPRSTDGAVEPRPRNTDPNDAHRTTRDSIRKTSTSEVRDPMTLKHPKAPPGRRATSPSRRSSRSRATTSRGTSCATPSCRPTSPTRSSTTS